MLRPLSMLGCTLILAACAVRMPAVPMHRFLDGDLDAVAAAMRTEQQDGAEENTALVLNILAQCELFLGDPEAAWRDFGTAGRIMGNWQTSGGEAVAAIVGSEGSKTWKGDPYEKAMNAFYLGLCYLWRGEPDNARASLKRGILADAEIGDEKFQADNPLLFWLAGRMSLLMGKDDDAEDFFKEARTANTFARQHGSRADDAEAVLGRPRDGNLVLLVECGLAPAKVAHGDLDELARFESRWHPAERARVELDGRVLGETVVLADLDYQARTLGGTEMEGIRKGKAVFKKTSLIGGAALLHVASRGRGDSARTSAIVGGGLILFGLLTSTAADIRHWPTLPATVQALTANVTPGPHTLVIEFLDAAGRAVPELHQTWSIDVPNASQTYYLFRSLPGLDRQATARAAVTGPDRTEVHP